MNIWRFSQRPRPHRPPVSFISWPTCCPAEDCRWKKESEREKEELPHHFFGAGSRSRRAATFSYRLPYTTTAGPIIVLSLFQSFTSSSASSSSSTTSPSSPSPPPAAKLHEDLDVYYHCPAVVAPSLSSLHPACQQALHSFTNWIINRSSSHSLLKLPVLGINTLFLHLIIAAHLGEFVGFLRGSRSLVRLDATTTLNLPLSFGR